MQARLDKIHKKVIHDMPQEIKRNAYCTKKNVDRVLKRVISVSSY